MADQFDIHKKTATGAVSNLLGLIGKKCLALIINIILVKMLSVAGYGVFNLYIAMMNTLGNLTFGTEKIAQRYFPMHLQDDKVTAITIFNCFFLLRYLIIIVLFIVGYLCSFLELFDYSKFSFPHVEISLLAGCIFAGQMFFMTALNAAYMEHKFINSAYVAGDLIKCILLLVYCKGSVLAAIIIYTCGELFVFCTIVFRFYKKINIRFVDYFSYEWRGLDFPRYFHYVKYMILASTGTYILSSNIDIFFISYLMQNEQVGVYAFSTKIPFILLMFAPSNLFFNVTLPVLINKIDSGSQANSLHNHILLFMKLNVVVWSILIALIFVNIKWIIAVVFSIKYNHTSGYILFWLIILYAHVIKNVFEPIARAIEYTRAYLFTIYAAILNLIGNFVLIPMLGVNGALIATGFSMIFQGIGLSCAVAKKIELPLRVCAANLLISRVLLITGTLLAIYLWSPEHLWQFVAVNAGLIALLCTLFSPFSWLSREEALFINGFIYKPLNRRLRPIIEKHW